MEDQRRWWTLWKLPKQRCKRNDKSVTQHCMSSWPYLTAFVNVCVCVCVCVRVCVCVFTEINMDMAVSTERGNTHRSVSSHHALGSEPHCTCTKSTYSHLSSLCSLGMHEVGSEPAGEIRTYICSVNKLSVATQTQCTLPTMCIIRSWAIIPCTIAMTTVLGPPCG